MGRQSRLLLDNPAFVEAVQALEAKYTLAWVNTAEGAVETREHAWRALNALRALTDELTILLDNGEIAAQQIEREALRNG